MPVLARIAARFEADRPLEGVTVAMCLHVTAETANLARALAAGGAEVALCSANPLSIQDDVAAAVVDVDTVIHTAAVIDLMGGRSVTDEYRQRSFAINVQGTQNLVRAARSARPRPRPGRRC